MTVRRNLVTAFALASTVGAVQAQSGAAARFQIVDERGIPLRDAVVEVRPANGADGSIRFPWRMAMAQKDMAFVPGTLVVAKGSKVAFPNLDKVRHSVYSFSKPARFEIELYGRDQTRSHLFAVAGSVAVGCNIHDDMRGYIRVTDTPYAAKTDGNGLVSISSLPRGSAQVTVWHRRMRAPEGEMTQTVTIAPGGSIRKLQVRLR
jgi:plastocyanin